MPKAAKTPNDKSEIAEFTIDGHKYKIQESKLAYQSYVPFADWFPQLATAAQHGVAHSEVEPFVAMIAPKAGSKTSLKSLEDWRAVLRLSTLWHFDRLRDLAISHLENMPLLPLEKLILARVGSVAVWFVAGYTALSLREHPLSVDEARQLDPTDVVRIFSAREEIHSHKRLSATLDSVSSYFARITEVSLSTSAQAVITAEPHPLSTPSSPSPSSSSQNSHVAVESRVHSPEMRQEETPHNNEASPADPDISLFLAGDFDAAVGLINSTNIEAYISRLGRASGFLVGKEYSQDVYQTRARNVAAVVSRRAVRDADFHDVAIQLMNSILQMRPKSSSVIAGSLRSLAARWKKFMDASGKIPKQDSDRIMPEGLTEDQYQNYMTIGRAFLTRLIGEDGGRLGKNFRDDHSWLLTSPETPHALVEEEVKLEALPEEEMLALSDHEEKPVVLRDHRDATG